MAGIGFIIASNLREMRQAKGMRQEEVARILGKSQSRVSAFEKGESIPDIETLIRFCDIFSTDANSILFEKYPRLLGEAREPTEEKTVVSPALKADNPQRTDDSQRCFELYEKLVQAKEQEIALLKENAALQAKNKELNAQLSLSLNAADETPQSSTA